MSARESVCSLRVVDHRRSALAVWFWTQSLLGARHAPPAGIGDGLHQLTAPLNVYFFEHPRAANALLIASSGCIDALGLFLLVSWLFGPSVRPFLGLLILLGLRQLMQALCALPPPPNMIWHDPGFPSLLVTYAVANDFFFSGHTAIAVFGATQLIRLGKTWLTALALACRRLRSVDGHRSSRALHHGRLYRRGRRHFGSPRCSIASRRPSIVC